jgi:hypothetical protein
MMSVSKHHRETLNFTDFSGYYGSMSAHDGYGGLDYADGSNFGVEYLNTSFFSRTDWCDTGYQNVAAATGASALGYIGYHGTFESADLKDSFSLKLMIAASAWDTNQEWTISTYTYSGGGLHLRDSENVYLSQSAQTLKFGALGRNIAAFTILVDDLGSGGNTCSSGVPTYGYLLAFGDLKLQWNGKIPTHSRGPHLALPRETLHAHSHVTPDPTHLTGSTHAPHCVHGAHTGGASGGDYHSQLLGLGHDAEGLTGEFKLPQTEHFGI